MGRIGQFLKSLEERARRELCNLKPSRKSVAYYVYDAYNLSQAIFILALCFEGVALFSVDTKMEVALTVQYSGYFYLALTLISVVFVYGCIYRIAPKIRSFDSTTQYKYMMASRRIQSAMLIGFVLLICFCSVLSSVIKLKPDYSDILILNKIVSMTLSITIVFVCSIFPWILIPFTLEAESELNFTLIQNFESIAQNSGLWTPTYVLKSLLKPIAHESERTVNQCLACEEFPSNFYRPFTILSLASILGVPEENKKAKEYFTGLRDIIMEKGENSSKASMVLKYLEKVGEDQSFASYRKMQDTFGFQYSFEHGRKRFSKILGRTGQIFLGVVTLIAFVFEIINYLHLI